MPPIQHVSPMVSQVNQAVPPIAPPISLPAPPMASYVPPITQKVQPVVTLAPLQNPIQSTPPTFSQIPLQPFNPQSFAPQTNFPAWNDPPPLGHKPSPRESVQPITLPAPPVAAPEMSRYVPPVPKPSELSKPKQLPDMPPEVKPLLQVSRSGILTNYFREELMFLGFR